MSDLEPDDDDAEYQTPNTSVMMTITKLMDSSKPQSSSDTSNATAVKGNQCPLTVSYYKCMCTMMYGCHW